MLKKIVIENFTTFKDKTTIDFTATNYKLLSETNVGNNKILKGALFVGENATGKTNILKAITLLLDMLIGELKSEQLELMKCFYSNKKTFKIEYIFDIDGHELDYLIEYGNKAIVSEKLVLDKKILIDRIGTNAKIYFTEEKTYDNIANQILFLRRMYFDTNFYENNILLKWLDYLQKSVYINCYNRKIKVYSNNISMIAENYLNDKDINKINKFLKEINYGTTVGYEYINDKLYPTFKKEYTYIFVPNLLESTGNITLFHLIPIFINVQNNDYMIILDEFSSGFHNNLEECLVRYFFQKSKNSQLFFVTHSTNLLNNSLLRPDQIYAVSFVKGQSKLFRFSNEAPRESQNIEKMYLNGVFNDIRNYTKEFKIK